MLWLQVHNVYVILADQALSLSYRSFLCILFPRYSSAHLSSNQYDVVPPSLSSCFFNGAFTAPYIIIFALSHFPSPILIVFTHKCTLVFLVLIISCDISFVGEYRVCISIPSRSSKQSVSVGIPE